MSHPQKSRNEQPQLAGPVHSGMCRQSVADEPPHWSVVQARPSSGQGVPAMAKPSPGQSTLEPSQLSSTSHGPADPRQTAVERASPGQPGPLPSQLSAGSHGPADARHSPPLRNPSPGQPALDPEQRSSASQGPETPRQTVPLWKPSPGQSG